MAASLCLMPALVVMMLAGSAWQGDAHMLFFAEVAVTAVLLDRQAMIVGAPVVALPHLALNSFCRIWCSLAARTWSASCSTPPSWFSRRQHWPGSWTGRQRQSPKRSARQSKGATEEAVNAIKEQGAATAEIARNVQQTAASTQEVTCTIAGVSQTARDTGAAAMQVLDAANDLSRQADQFTKGIDRFVAGVRAA